MTEWTTEPSDEECGQELTELLTTHGFEPHEGSPGQVNTKRFVYKNDKWVCVTFEEYCIAQDMEAKRNMKLH